MKRLFRLAFIIVLCTTFLLSNNQSTTAHRDERVVTHESISQTASDPWYTEYVHQAVNAYENLGQYPSLIYSPDHGTPEIFYYRADSGYLMLATRTTNDCTGSSSWHCFPLTGGVPNLGAFLSADTYQEVDGWKFAVSFHDSTNGALRVVIGRVSGENINWDWQTIDMPATGDAGHFTSLKFYPNGVIGIAYYIAGLGENNQLKYAHSVGGGGNCGVGDAAGFWNCETITTGTLGQYNSLDISWNNYPFISTYAPVNKDLWIAYYVGSGGTCGAWQCLLVDSGDGADVGISSSISAPQQSGGPLRIAYYDKTNSKLKFYNSGYGAPMVVDDISISPQPGISMDIDQEGLAVIAYQRVASGNSPQGLAIARPYLAFHDNEYGNCGDILQGLDHQYWRCSTIDPGNNNNFEADFVSVRVDANGRVGVAFTEDDLVNNNLSLKYASQSIQTYLPVLSGP